MSTEPAGPEQPGTADPVADPATVPGQRAGTAPVDGPEGPDWQRLSLRSVPVHLSWLLAPAATAAGTALGGHGRLNLQALITVASLTIAFGVVAGINLMRCLTTRYRVTHDRLEVHKGLLFRSRRTVLLGRIRNADVTAKPLQRLAGLAAVTVGVAAVGSSGGSLTLDGVTRDQAAALRRDLLNRRAALLAAGHDGQVEQAADDTIAAFDPSWTRYAPLTVWGVGGLFAVLGAAYRTLHEMQVDPLELGVVRSAADAFTAVPVWVAVPVTLLAVAAVGTAGAVALYVEGWSGFRLAREEGGILRVRRGLWIHRSVSIEERRLRGVELVEPLLLRSGGGARLQAVAGGLGSAEENRSRGALMPPSPRSEVLRVAAAVLGDDRSPTERADLHRHPRRALRRRLNRALLVVLPVVGAVALPGIWLPAFLVAAGISAAVLLPAGALLAADAHRALGHGLTGPYLVARSGTFVRRTVALRREGVIGWTVSRSYFQRRAGLLTLGAATAAGAGVYRVRDVAEGEGLAFAEEAVPGLLAPFLVRD
ncbi:MULTISPECIES: PH domain-containing protein [unclassified Kitasatospora]|uniref:PH domain-containing protein n=1 Tax=unclassified Kitasatospora TaxID=2633591 RepID=UPI0033D44EC3